MPDDPDPPRKFYGFKDRGFEVVNPRTDAPGAGAPIDVRDLFNQATVPPWRAKGPGTPPPAHPPAAPAVPTANDVHAMLRDNLAHANEAGLNELAAKPPRSSRRNRDYWISMGASNAFFVPLAIGGFATGNAILFVYSIAGIAILNSALWWIFWQILDDY